jgi:hypothetical protein
MCTCISFLDISLTLCTAMDQGRWSPDVYQHYNVHLRCKDMTKVMYHQFVCKYGNVDHGVYERERSKALHGTSNLGKAAKNCNQRRGVQTGPQVRTVGPYSEAQHRAVIAMRCATSNRLAQVVNDKYYRMEVDMLCPGTIIPLERTISRDLNLLHQELAAVGKKYFIVSPVSLADEHKLSVLHNNVIAMCTLPLTDGQIPLQCQSWVLLSSGMIRARSTADFSISSS